MSLVQRDYILRLFEQMGQVITVVIGLKKDGEPAEAMQVLNRNLQGLVGFDLDDIEHIGAADVVKLVRIARSGSDSVGEVVAGQLTVVAHLLQEAAGVYDLQGEPARADSARLKALHVYLVVLTEENAGLEPAREAIAPLTEQVADYALPYTLTDLLWRYHEQEGNFAQAENCLFELLEGAESDEGTLGRGIAFYSRLLDRSDPELQEGGLPREEVEAGLAELMEM